MVDGRRGLRRAINGDNSGQSVSRRGRTIDEERAGQVTITGQAAGERIGSKSQQPREDEVSE